MTLKASIAFHGHKIINSNKFAVEGNIEGQYSVEKYFLTMNLCALPGDISEC